MKILICISGASSASLAIDFAKASSKRHKVYLVASKGAKKVLKHEQNTKLKKELKGCKNIRVFKDSDLHAPISSGSFRIDCAFFYASSDFCAAALAGRCDTLIHRAFAVNLKEKRRILIAPREMPLSAVMLRNLYQLARLGCVIAPPLFAGYSTSCESEFIFGKWHDALGLKGEFNRWGE